MSGSLLETETIIKKALMTLRSFMDDEYGFFPEFTKKQAGDWILRQCLGKFDSIAMSAYLSLLGNHKKRREIFGF